MRWLNVAEDDVENKEMKVIKSITIEERLRGGGVVGENVCQLI